MDVKRGVGERGTGDGRPTFSAHGDAVGYTDGVELPSDHAAALNGPLDRLPEVEHYVLSVPVHESPFTSVLETHDACYTQGQRSSYTHVLDTGGHSLARVPLPPHRRDANLRRILHHLLVRDARAVEHGLAVSVQPLVSHFVEGGTSLTWAPGKSWSLVRAWDHLFSGPPGGRAFHWMYSLPSWSWFSSAIATVGDPAAGVRGWRVVSRVGGEQRGCGFGRTADEA